MAFDKKFFATACLIVAGAGLALWGYVELLTGQEFQVSGPVLLLESLLLTAQTVSFPFGGPPGGLQNLKNLPWQLEAARGLLAVGAISGVVLVISRAFRRNLRAFWARFAQGHVIVSSAGGEGTLMVEHLASTGRRKEVVVLDFDPGPAHAEHYHGLGVAVLKAARPVREAQLLRVGLARAKAFVALSGDDVLNMEMMLKAKAISARHRHGDRRPLIARAAIADPDLRQASSLMLSALSPAFEYGSISVERISVRRLLADHPVDRDPEVRRGGRVHVLIVGLGRTGEALVLEIGRSAHLADGRKPRVTVVDAEAGKRVRALIAKYPGLPHAAELDAFDFELRERAYGSMEHLILEARPSRGVVCLRNDGLGLTTAARIREIASHAEMPDLPVHVRLSHAPAIADALASAKSVALTAPEIIPFGSPAGIYTREVILEESLDQLARAVHEHYRNNTGASGTSSAAAAMLPWESLPETFREASRHQADHIGIKLRSVGCASVPGAPCRLFAFREDEIEIMSRMEHARWCAERFISGWQYGPVRKDATLEHPSLVPWEQLFESEREKDRQAVRAIPAILQSAGYDIRRTQGSAGAAPHA